VTTIVGYGTILCLKKTSGLVIAIGIFIGSTVVLDFIIIVKKKYKSLLGKIIAS